MIYEAIKLSCGEVDFLRKFTSKVDELKDNSTQIDGASILTRHLAISV